MPTVEVYGTNEMTPLFVGDFAFLPRCGEHIAKDVGGYFEYYHVVESWYREEGESGIFHACVRVVDDDEFNAARKSRP